MADVEFLISGRWPVDGRPIAMIRPRLRALASRFGAPLMSYWEDGLGPACCIAGRLKSGVLFLFEEIEGVVTDPDPGGPSLFVDVSDVASRGVESVLGEVLTAMGLSRHDVMWAADESFRQTAAAIVTEVRASPRPTDPPRRTD